MEYLFWISLIVLNCLNSSCVRGELNSATLSNSAIEADMAEMFPDDESIAGYDSLVQKILENGETIYYRADPKFPIFHRLSNDADRKYVVLKHEEAHLNPADNKTKIILRQQEAVPTAYTVHMAVISPSKDILWDAVVVEQRKQDEDIITDLRKTYAEPNNNLPGATTCAWIGNIILCSGATESSPVDRVDHPPVFRDIQFDTTGRRTVPQDTEENRVDLEQVTSEADIKQTAEFGSTGSEKAETPGTDYQLDSTKKDSNLKKREVRYTNTLNPPDQELVSEDAESSSGKVETESAAANIAETSRTVPSHTSNNVKSELASTSTIVEAGSSKASSVASMQAPEVGKSTIVTSGSSSADTNIDSKVASVTPAAVPSTATETKVTKSPLSRSRTEVDATIKHNFLNPYIALTPRETEMLKKPFREVKVDRRYNPFDSDSDDYMDIDDHFNEQFPNAPIYDDYDELTPYPSSVNKRKPFMGTRRTRVGEPNRIRPAFEPSFQNTHLAYQNNYKPSSRNLYQSGFERAPQVAYQSSFRPSSPRGSQNTFKSPSQFHGDSDFIPQLPYQHDFKQPSQRSVLNTLKPTSPYESHAIQSIPRLSHEENFNLPSQRSYQHAVKRNAQVSNPNGLERPNQFPYRRTPSGPSYHRTTSQPTSPESEFRKMMKHPAPPSFPTYKYEKNYGPILKESPGRYSNGPPAPIFPMTKPGSGDYSDFVDQSNYKNRRFEKQYLTKGNYYY